MNQTDKLQNKILVSQSMATFYDSCNYKKKIQELKQDIERSRTKGHSIEETIAAQNQKWKRLFDQ